MTEFERPPVPEHPANYPVVKQLWEIYYQMRGVSGWSWVLNPWAVQQVMLAYHPDGGSALTFSVDGVTLFGRFVRYDTNMTTIAVEWH